jgi:hypothetical protein
MKRAKGALRARDLQVIRPARSDEEAPHPAGGVKLELEHVHQVVEAAISGVADEDQSLAVFE